jgi:hypothetical protein
MNSAFRNTDGGFIVTRRIPASRCGVFAALVAIGVLVAAGLTTYAVDVAYAQGSPSPGADSLKQLGEELCRAHSSGNLKRAAEINKVLLPDVTQIARALSAEVAPDVLNKVTEMHSKLPKGEQQLAELIRCKPNQSVIKVYEATTEEIARSDEKSVAYKEFPDGVRGLATIKILRSKMTFYELVFLEPGNDAGMKYHLFYWDGQDWKMLGPIWRVLQ